MDYATFIKGLVWLLALGAGAVAVLAGAMTWAMFTGSLPLNIH